MLGLGCDQAVPFSAGTCATGGPEAQKRVGDRMDMIEMPWFYTTTTQDQNFLGCWLMANEWLTTVMNG